MLYKLTVSANIKMAVDITTISSSTTKFCTLKQPTFSHVIIPQTMLLYLCGAFYIGGHGLGDCVLFCTTENLKNVLLAHNKIQKNSLAP